MATKFTPKETMQLGMVTKMYNEGKSMSEIATETKLSESKVRAWIKDYVIPAQNKKSEARG